MNTTLVICADREFAKTSYSIGFGTNGGTVAAASNWDEPMEVKTVRPALAGSYERLCHETGEPRFLLPLRELVPDTCRGFDATPARTSHRGDLPTRD